MTLKITDKHERTNSERMRLMGKKIPPKLLGTKNETNGKKNTPTLRGKKVTQWIKGDLRVDMSINRHNKSQAKNIIFDEAILKSLHDTYFLMCTLKNFK